MANESDLKRLSEAAEYLAKLCEQGGPDKVTNWYWAVDEFSRALEKVDGSAVFDVERVRKMLCGRCQLGAMARATGGECHCDANSALLDEARSRGFVNGPKPLHLALRFAMTATSDAGGTCSAGERKGSSGRGALRCRGRTSVAGDSLPAGVRLR
jgi:hypothetical protein